MKEPKHIGPYGLYEVCNFLPGKLWIYVL